MTTDRTYHNETHKFYDIANSFINSHTFNKSNEDLFCTFDHMLNFYENCYRAKVLTIPCQKNNIKDFIYDPLDDLSYLLTYEKELINYLDKCELSDYTKIFTVLKSFKQVLNFAERTNIYPSDLNKNFIIKTMSSLANTTELELLYTLILKFNLEFI